MLRLDEVMDVPGARRTAETAVACINRPRNSMLRAHVLALAAFALVSPGVPANAQESQTETVFVQGRDEYPAHILHERIALVLSEDVLDDPDRFERVRNSLGGKPISTLPPFVIEVAAPGLRDVARLKSYARELGASQSGLVVDTGLLITIGQSTQPFVLTDKIIVQIAEDEKPELIENIAAEFDANVLGGNPFNPRQFVISLRPDDRRNALEVSNAINKDPRVRYALPNFYAPIEKRQASVTPNDTFFGNQWHLHNTGQGGGTADADIDADLAWSFGLGDSDIIIAIIDDGFEMDHPDLMNGGVVNGYDFTGCSGTLPCGGSRVEPYGMFNNHGTAAAGVALARSNNSLGVSGVCPQCTFMPIRVAGPIYAFGVAIDHAHTMGADVISLSWGSPIGAPPVNNVVDAVNNAAANGRGGLGSVVLFAMTNQIDDNCAGSTPDISSLPNAIAVSRSTNQDRFSPGGFGACMDVLAPTSGGTLHGVTTDRQDTKGFNTFDPFSGCPSPEPAPPPDSNLDYTFCFQGTSFATPLVAGVAGLVLSQDNTLIRQQVQQLLQDTADKISDSSGAYSDTTGFSPTHGYGRVNAFEAVRTVASTANDGRGGVDVYLRDNRLDWGNTEQLSNVTFEATRGFIPHWQSVDIKIDAPPLLSNAPATSSEFDAFVHENPLSGTLNRVYVRVHNRGHRPATDVTMKLQWAFAGAGLPALPADFWTAFPSDPADVSIWHPLPITTIASVPYSGTSLAGAPIDGSTVVTFDFNAPAFDASLPNPDHYCLFAVIDAPDDGVSTVVTSSHVPDFITPRDNNVTHRNVHLLDSGQSNILEDRLVVSNPFQHPIETRLVAQPPGEWRITIAGSEPGKTFELGAYESVPVNVSILPGDDNPATIDVVQLYRGPGMEKEEPLGGITYDVAIRKPVSGPGIVELVGRHQLLVEKYQETVLEMISKRALSSEEKAMLDQLGTLLEEQGRLLRRADGGGRQ